MSFSCLKVFTAAMSNDSLRTLYTYMRVQLDTDGGKGSLSVETDI